MAVQNGRQVQQQQQIMGRPAIRALFPMKTKGPAVRDKTLYSRVSYPAAGAAETLCFQDKNGASGKTLYDTNMSQPGQIDDKKDFFLEGFDIMPISAGATEAAKLADLEAVLNYGLLVLEDEDGKEVFSDGPLRIFVSDRSLLGVDTTQGNSDRVEPYMMRNPINMEAGQSFTVAIRFPGVAPTPSAAISLLVKMLGQEHTGAIET
jgi:hypothetical protein